MSLNIGQAPIAGTALAFIIPPGACSITVYSAAATTLYLGHKQEPHRIQRVRRLHLPDDLRRVQLQRRGHGVRAEHRSDNPRR